MPIQFETDIGADNLYKEGSIRMTSPAQAGEV